MRKKIQLKHNAYSITGEAIEHGIGWGIQHYNKYASNPIPDDVADVLREKIHNDIMLELCEVIDWDKSG